MLFVRNLLIVTTLSIIVISNIHISIPSVYAEKEIEPVIKFDRQMYGPLDSVWIEIVYPPANIDPTKSDRLKAKIFTSSGISKDLLFWETTSEFDVLNTGVFNSVVSLTPDPEKWWGDLKVERDDQLIVEFKTKDNSTFTKKADVNYNLGAVRFSKDHHLSRGKAEIVVWDPDRNRNPDTIDLLSVRVWSTTEIYEIHGNGIIVTLRETSPDSDEFRGFITFTKNQTSSGTRLRVSDGDTVTARYTDNTRLPTGEFTPKGSERFSVREVFASTLVSDYFGPPLERAFMPDPQIFSQIGENIPVTQLAIGNTAIIRTNITNAANNDIHFAYITQVKNSNNVVVSLSWLRGELKVNETMRAETTWMPESSGTYTIENFLWSDVDNPSALSPIRTTQVEVEHR